MKHSEWLHGEIIKMKEELQHLMLTGRRDSEDCERLRLWIEYYSNDYDECLLRDE